MKVTINGGAAELPAGATVGDAVRTLTSLTSGVAVALNGEVVSRSAWDSTPVADGDGVEVLTAVQGG
ncbi:sulfur carrier protein ThiS [Microbispora sp. NPDC004025]